MMDYLSNRQNVNFHDDLTTAKFSTGEDKSHLMNSGHLFASTDDDKKVELKDVTYEEEEDEALTNYWTKKNKANSTQPPAKQTMNRGHDDDDNDDAFSSRGRTAEPASSAARGGAARAISSATPAKEKRVFGRAKKEAQNKEK